MRELIEVVARGIEAVAIAIILGGIVYAFVAYWLDRAAAADGLYKRFKIRIGKSLLLGLEFLVAADIIRTVALNPTLMNVVALGVLVVIRTFLSWALLVEMEGRWPWQPKAGFEGKSRNL